MEMEGTIVEYIGSSEKSTKCGYCKSPDTSYTEGVWGYRMTCQDYQTLVDRGFQRSGNYVYRPMMKETCCPQYVIRMDATKFKLSKSQKSSLKKFKRYIIEGRKEDASRAEMDPNPLGEVVSESGVSNTANLDPEGLSSAASTSTDRQPPNDKGKQKVKKVVRPGVGPDPKKPPCQKAKVLRQERKAQKKLLVEQQLESSSTPTSSSQGDVDKPKLASEEEPSHPLLSQDLNTYFTFPKDDKCAHKFRTQLVPVDTPSEDFATTSDESFVVFHKFQTGIHKEAKEDAQRQQFKDFLIDTPLITEKHTDTISYGTFHLQYLLDEKIFAVGVLDILPKGVLCEYLYYDPYYRFIAPGVISALMEISLTQQYYLQDSAMRYYYMGYYVQSCPKMNYKSRYSSSALLCMETYTYVNLDKCVPVLKCTPYARLAAPEVENAVDDCSDDKLRTIPLLIRGGGIMKYGTYKQVMGDELDTVMKDYVNLVGNTLAASVKVHVGATDSPTEESESSGFDDS